MEVSHMKFGEGKVVNLGEKDLIILWPQGEKKFLYPSSFKKFLTFKDENVQTEMNTMLRHMMEEEESRRLEELSEQERLEEIQNLKIHPDSQAAFGFVENDRERVFSAWTVYAGSYQSGGSKGNPKLPVRLKLNSACLLTECPKGVAEKRRRIIGAFMLQDNFESSACRDGMIQSHEKYRIQLGDKETLLYWDYFSDGAEISKWGNVELKYFSNIIMQKILCDMQKGLLEEADREKAEEFYRYFCMVNRLKPLEQ
jgi:hypothetical protein